MKPKPAPAVATAALHALGLVAHHHEDTLGRRQGLRGADDMLDQAAAAHAMEHLGFPRLHTGAQPGRENHNGQRRFHEFYFLSAAASRCRRPS
jgi:hypothetical protein